MIRTRFNIILLVFITQSAHAEMTFTLSEDIDAGVIRIEANGSFNLDGLIACCSHNLFTTVIPNQPSVIVGPSGVVTHYIVDNEPTIFGPFGVAGFRGAGTHGAGDLVGFDRHPFNNEFNIYVPPNYQSGDPLFALGEFAGSFASLGINPGTYNYQYNGIDNNGPTDIVSVHVVPEPTSLVLLGLAGVFTLRSPRRDVLASRG